MQRDKIRRLYAGEGARLLDTELLEDVGIALLVRCESILMVSSGRLRCPSCGTVFALERPTGTAPGREQPCPAPGCSWRTTWNDFHASWSKRRLYGGNAVSAYRTYAAAYPSAATPAAKMIAIDQLLHAFHWDLKDAAPNRLAADNLIEGNHTQVLQLLDELFAAGPSEWRDTVDRMKRRRSGAG